MIIVEMAIHRVYAYANKIAKLTKEIKIKAS
jgi:hypothetical protein